MTKNASRKHVVRKTARLVSMFFFSLSLPALAGPAPELAVHAGPVAVCFDARASTVAQKWNGAFTSWKECLEQMPGNEEALTNTLFTASLLAEHGGGTPPLAEEAKTVLEELLKTAPPASVWYKWGILLAAQADATQDDEQERLWEQAGEKFQKATEIDPGLQDAWFNWGKTLATQADAIQGEKQQRLWMQAEEKFKKVVEINPDMQATWFIWGKALADWAAVSQGEKRQLLFKQAEEKFAKATGLKPDDQEAWLAWANLLSSQAGTLEGEEQKRQLAQAEEKFQKGMALTKAAEAP